jgi:hypothetical protein
MLIAPPTLTPVNSSSGLPILFPNIATADHQNKSTVRRMLFTPSSKSASAIPASITAHPISSPYVVNFNCLPLSISKSVALKISFIDTILDFLEVSCIKNQALREVARSLHMLAEYLRLPQGEKHQDLELFMRSFLNDDDNCGVISRKFQNAHRTKFYTPFCNLIEHDNKELLIYLCAEYLQECRDADLGKWNWLIKDNGEEIIRTLLHFDLGLLRSVLSKIARDQIKFSNSACVNILHILLEHIIEKSPCNNLCYSDQKELLIIAKLFLFELKNTRHFSSIDNRFAEVEEQLLKIVVLENDHLTKPEIRHGELTGLHYLSDATTEKIPQTFEISHDNSDSFGIVEIKVPLLVYKREPMAIGVYSYDMKDAATGTVFHSNKLSSFMLGGNVDFEDYVRAIGYILQHPLNKPTVTQIDRKKYLGSYCVNGNKISLLVWTRVTAEHETVVSAYPVIIEVLQTDRKSEDTHNWSIAEVSNDETNSLVTIQNIIPDIFSAPIVKLQKITAEAAPLEHFRYCSAKDKKMITTMHEKPWR